MVFVNLPPISLCFIFYTFLLTSIVEVMAARLPDIYWNATNPIFRIDNTDHIIDVNRGNVPYEYDQINIICPMYSKGTREEDIETYIIYNVSKEEYDTCHIANPAVARTIAVCDDPYATNRYYTITFRPFTPQPGGLEFRPGQDYYFIALSAKANEANPTKHCQKYHMKVVFKVCCKRPQQPTFVPTPTNSSSRSSTTAPVVSSTIRPVVVTRRTNEIILNLKSTTTRVPPRASPSTRHPWPWGGPRYNSSLHYPPIPVLFSTVSPIQLPSRAPPKPPIWHPSHPMRTTPPTLPPWRIRTRQPGPPTLIGERGGLNRYSSAVWSRSLSLVLLVSSFFWSWLAQCA